MVVQERNENFFMMPTVCKMTPTVLIMTKAYVGLLLKSVRVHFAYGRIALTLKLLGQFERFLDENDRCKPPSLLISFSRLLGLKIKS